MKGVEKGFHLLKKRHEAVLKTFSETIYEEFVKDAYEAWQPELNERAYFVDFIRMIWSMVKIDFIGEHGFSAINISSERRCNYTVDLSPDQDDLNLPVFVVPEKLFNELNLVFELKAGEN